MKAQRNRLIAVLISDVHYNINTLEVADKAMRMAISCANALGVRVVVCGDLHDSKANLRGECVNAMIKTWQTAKTPIITLRGNHDSLNERSEEHSLNFLAPYGKIVGSTIFEPDLQAWLVPYHHNPDELREFLRSDAVEADQTLIMHQGIQDASPGHYIQDKSALTKDDLAGLRVISGHYHTRQSFALPHGGKFDYVGNPYTLNFAEARDPEKGFQILCSDGSLEFVPTDLRAHRVLEYTVEQLKGDAIFLGEPNDIVWVKVTGTQAELARLTKSQVAYDLDITQDFRLDLIPVDVRTDVSTAAQQTLSNAELYDSLIDSLTNTEDARKVRLKALWKQFA